MKRRQKIEITVETDQLLVLRRRQPCADWCEECAAQVEMLTAQQAASVFGVSVESIYHHVGNHQIHFTETADGHLFICPNSPLNPSKGELL